MADDLSGAELADLLRVLETGVHGTATGFTKNTVLLGVLYAFILGGFAVRRWWMALACGAVVVGIGLLARKRTSPERMQPVFDAVRDAPADITWVRHYETSDSMRLFVRHWIEIKTPGHRFVMQTRDWKHVMDLLHRRCPGATFVDR